MRAFVSLTPSMRLLTLLTLVVGTSACAHTAHLDAEPPESELDRVRQDNAALRNRIRKLEQRVKMIEQGGSLHAAEMGAPGSRPLPVVKLEAPDAGEDESDEYVSAEHRRLRNAKTLQRVETPTPEPPEPGFIADAGHGDYAGYDTGYGSGAVAPGHAPSQNDIPDEWRTEESAPSPALSVEESSSSEPGIKSYRLVGSHLVNATKRHKPKADKPPRGKRGSAIIAQYERARSMYKSGDFKAAEQAFDRFVKSYPQHDYADNALYWKGESAYDQAHYSDALASFTAVVERYGGGNKAPDALLKIGLCYGKVGDHANARDVLEQLVAAYPKANASKIARSKLPQFGGSQ